MGIIRSIKKIDSKNRLAIPKEWGSNGDYVYFEITKAGHLLVKKHKAMNVEDTEEE